MWFRLFGSVELWVCPGRGCGVVQLPSRSLSSHSLLLSPQEGEGEGG